MRNWRRRFRTIRATTGRPPRGTRTRAAHSTLVSDDELDRINPTEHGREKGQIDGTAEDGGLTCCCVPCWERTRLRCNTHARSPSPVAGLSITCENMISQEYCGHRYRRDEPTPWGTNSHVTALAGPLVAGVSYVALWLYGLRKGRAEMRRAQAEALEAEAAAAAVSAAQAVIAAAQVRLLRDHPELFT
jgi:hypothetical protein